MNVFQNSWEKAETWIQLVLLDQTPTAGVAEEGGVEADREEDADRLPPGSHLEDALPLPPPTLQPLSTSLGWQN